MTHIVEMHKITKRFGGLVALDNVSFSVNKGTIHALVGENGAGKSTLMNILCGKYSCHTYSGSTLVEGKEVRLSTPKDATNKGISMVHQELTLIPEISVAENMFLGNQPMKNGVIDWKSMYERAKEELKKLSLDIDSHVLVKYLSVGQQQLIEICKAIMLGGRIMILDEPTSPLTGREIDFLFKILIGLKNEGISIIYITHRLDEIFQLTDKVSIMRDGQMIVTKNTSEVNKKELVSYMIGREMSDFYPKMETEAGEVALAVEHYFVRHPVYSDKNIIQDINMHFKKGEIVGISGLLGAGRTELMSAVVGAYATKGKGSILINGKQARIRSPYDAIKHGIGYVTENRKGNGLILAQTIKFNICLANLDSLITKGILNRRKEIAMVNEQVQKLHIKTNNVNNPTSSLSGGNQQKVVLAKWLSITPGILILDEPTRGVDVGAKYEIYTLIKNLAKSGVAVIMVSSDLPEIIGMSDRVYVMYEGTLSGELAKNELTENRIMQLATGLTKQ